MEKNNKEEKNSSNPEGKDPEEIVEPKEQVTMDKDKLDKLLDRLERVEATADKSRLHKYDSLRSEKKDKIIKLRMINGKVIKKIETIENSVEKNPNTGIYNENQLIKIFYETGGYEQIPYVQYSRIYEYLPAVVKKESFDKETKKITYRAVTSEGKEYTIEDSFIN